MTDLENKEEWLRPIKERGPSGGFIYTFKSSCCGLIHSWNYGEKPVACPSCGNVLWNYPKHEFHLFTLQAQLLEHPEQREDTLLKVFKVLNAYARVLISSMLKSSKASLPVEKFDRRSEELAYEMYFIVLAGRQVHQSWGAWMKRIATDTLWGKNTRDEELVALEDSNRDGKELWERVQAKTPGLISQEEVLRTPVSTEIIKLLKTVSLEVRKQSGAKMNLLVLNGLMNKFRKLPAPYFDRYFLTFGSDARQLIDAVELALYEHYQELAI